MHSKAFDGLKGDFPIGFTIWQPSKSSMQPEIKLSILNKNCIYLGEKTLYQENKNKFLSSWVERPRANKQLAIPLKNAISIGDRKSAENKQFYWNENAIGYMLADSNDLQNASSHTCLFSSIYVGGHGTYITADNLAQNAVVFAVRRLVKHTWINDRDQFLQPNCELPQEFYDDCLVWMLFNGSNLSAGANGLEYAGKQWSLVNHFVPFTEDEVGALRFESDFMSNYIKTKNFSPEAEAVLEAGKLIWQAYFKSEFDYNIRNELRLGRSDVGWYQIRNALAKKGYKFDEFKKAYEVLSEKLIPKVYEYGFLKD